MKKDRWYEVFQVLPDNEGTQTIQECKNLKEARDLKKKYSKLYKELHIDKWTTKNGFPQPIQEFKK